MGRRGPFPEVDASVSTTVRIVDYFCVETSDQPGAAARILSYLMDRGVNLIVLHGFQRGATAQLDLVPSDPAAFTRVIEDAKWDVSGPKKALFVEGEDRIGALIDHFAALAEAGINLLAADAVAARAGRFGAILWLQESDVHRAARVLGIEN
jgi:hypothetical protein